MFNFIKKIFTKSRDNKGIYHADSPLYFNNVEDFFIPDSEIPSYNYLDFNNEVRVSDYLGLENENSKTKFFLKAKNINIADGVIADAVILVKEFTSEQVEFHFGWITSESGIGGNEHFGGMTYLVATIIYIILNDSSLKNHMIRISLDMRSEAQEVAINKKVDVYYKIFQTPKNISDVSEFSFHRVATFSPENRKCDLEYFKGIIQEKERSILSVLDSYR